MSYSIGELAKKMGVSMRTLRHYDEIGLLVPMERTAAGYRRYGEEEVERLRRIMIYRELGFDLARITRILDNPASDAEEQLEHQKSALQDQVARLENMLRGINEMISESGASEQPGEVGSEGAKAEAVESSSARVAKSGQMWLLVLIVAIAGSELGWSVSAIDIHTGPWAIMLSILFLWAVLWAFAGRMRLDRSHWEFHSLNLSMWVAFLGSYFLREGFASTQEMFDILGEASVYPLVSAFVGHVVLVYRRWRRSRERREVDTSGGQGRFWRTLRALVVTPKLDSDEPKLRGSQSGIDWVGEVVESAIA